MKKIYTLSALLATSLLCSAQYTENFDSYTPGDYIGVVSTDWTTWSGTTGGAEDAQVVNAQAQSPNNSIHFVGNTASGGPQDVVLPFGGAYNTGRFEYSQAMRIKTGTGAYFNFQGDAAIGSTWVINVYFSDAGTFGISDGQGNLHLDGTYASDVWFTMSFDIDLNTNDWKVYLNGNLLGSFANPTNRIASIDIFPTNPSTTNNLSEFWIDDVSYTHTPYTLSARNGAMTDLGFRTPAISGANQKPTVTVRNLGTQAITSFDITVDYNGQQITESVSGVNIGSLATYNYEFNQTLLLSTAVNSVSATISNVNGSGADMDPADDTKSTAFTPVVPAPGKLVIVEEATGTWCGWCPRGTVAMDFLGKDYKGYAQGIAVHNNDPMENSTYDAGIGTAINGYPSALVNRMPSINPAAIFDPVMDEIQVAPTAFIENGAEYDATTSTLKVSALVDFKVATSGDWRVVAVLTEDSVHGTAAGYAQANYYSNSQDLIGYDGVNWRNLPSTVPAAQMVYDHVARAIAPAYNGVPNTFPANIGANTLHAINFNFTLAPGWDIEKMHVVTMLLKPNGEIDNGGAATVNEAIANGFVETGTVSLSENLNGPDARLQVYPNPSANGFVDVFIDNKTQNTVVNLVNLRGEVVFTQTLNGAEHGQQLRINTASLAAGLYVVKASFGKQQLMRKIVIE